MEVASRKQKLVDLGAAAIADHQNLQRQSMNTWRMLRSSARALPQIVALLGVSACVMLASGLVALYANNDSSPSQSRSYAVDAFVVVTLVVIVLAANTAVLRRESILAKRELGARLEAVLNSISSCQDSILTDIGASSTAANIASVSLARIQTSNNSSILLPFNLLLEGDIILLHCGEKTPARVQSCFPDTLQPIPASHARYAVLEKGQMLKPSAFVNSPSSIPAHEIFHFKLLETPLLDTLNSMLYSRRPDSVIYHQLHVITTTLTQSVIWSIFAASLVINVFRYAFLSNTGVRRIDEALILLSNAQFYSALLPLLPFSLPIICLIARAYGNAQIICLHEAIQASTEDFKDEENIDDFDAAPPPTKEVETDYKALWRVFKSQLFTPHPVTASATANGRDAGVAVAGTPGGGPPPLLPLSRTTNLVESLATATVICSIDREGTVSMPFPTIDSLFFMSDQAGIGATVANSAAAAAGSSSGAPGSSSASATPGLSVLASAGEASGSNSLSTSTPFANVTPIVNNAEAVVLDLKEEPFARSGVRFEDKEWKSYMDSLKPLGLSFLLGTLHNGNSKAGLVPDTMRVDTGAGQLRRPRFRTENHRRPVSHRPNSDDLSHPVENLGFPVKPARQTCLCRVSREIGFSDTAVDQFSHSTSINWVNPSVDPSYPLPLNDYHFEVPSSRSLLFSNSSPGAGQPVSFQLFSEGNVDLIVQSCADYWCGSGLEMMTEAAERKIFEFYQNAVHSDMQVIAYSYRPVADAVARRLSSHSYIFNAPLHSSAIKNETPIISEKASTDTTEVPTLRRRKPQRSNMTASVIDSPVFTENMLESTADTTYIREVLKCQTFLGLAALFYEPKPNISNVIEDLKLAGIRFVYFSEAPERESKAYSERLGLEIDWNSCILLSPAVDGTSSGYLELHDMKAQLPRGVDKVRAHIENVDDVPLRVSLFAEASPPSILEMIRIFQEYGEVVVCLGSSLNEVNAESFATADLAVAVDPFLAMKGLGVGSGGVSPLVLGAGITTAPCALRFNFDTSVYSLTQLIREARTLVMNAQQGFSFHFGCQMALSCLTLLSYLFLLPPIFTGYQMIWLLWIILPIQSAAFLFTPHDSDAMKLMPVKNSDHMKDKWRSAQYYVTRFAMTSCGTVLIFVLALWHFLNVSREPGNPPPDAAMLFGKFGMVSWLRLDPTEAAVLLYAQHIALFYFVISIVVASATFLSRTRNVLELPPWKNQVWIALALLTLLAQTVFSAISLAGGPLSLVGIPWYIIFVTLFCGVVLNVPIQEVVKRYDKMHWVRSQKLAQLQFNTKLGMHSPL
ncbi:hypothetical protein HDU78_006897 [Chytriomyces hyalinus]|nr:hypothetical protein HDU78_006897 [Chytriomyces hyalinus]